MDTVAPITQTKNLVDEHIAQIIAERKQQANVIGGSYELLWEQIERVLNAGGKRIRPHLTVTGYGKLDERILPIAAAQELIHVAMLIHDDVIDGDIVRHSTPNISGFYRKAYGKDLPDDKATHYADSAAILAGDALISEAYRQIFLSKFDDKTKQLITNQFATSIYEVIGGELLDVEAAFVTNNGFDPLKIYHYKTASYSFIGPLLCGAYCADADNATKEILRSFGSYAGIAYQIQDDLLGVFGDAQQTGKSIFTDLREAKLTLLLQFHRDTLSARQLTRFNKSLQGLATEKDLQKLKEQLVESGAYQKTIDAMVQYFEHANQQLQRLSESPQKTELTSIFQKLQGRNR